MVEKCAHEKCKQEGTQIVDFTCGPLCDYRFYCPTHVQIGRDECSAEFKKRDEIYKASLPVSISAEDFRSVVEALEEIDRWEEQLIKWSYGFKLEEHKQQEEKTKRVISTIRQALKRGV